jgi:hypothetical protein
MLSVDIVNLHSGGSVKAGGVAILRQWYSIGNHRVKGGT